MDGKVAGIMIGANQRKKAFHIQHFLKAIWYSLLLLPIKKVYKKEPILKEYQKNMKKMKKEIFQCTDAEINLFLLKQEYRGCGIGNTLYSNIEKYFLQSSVASYYVHTDTGCNYNFYLKHGMHILAERKTNISYADENDITMYILGKEYLESGSDN